MAGSKTGVPTIWRNMVKITQLKQKYGASDAEARLGAGFAACIDAIVTCVLAVYATDDQPLQIERHAPFGPEDQPPL